MPSLYWAPYTCITPVYHTKCFSAWTQSSESNPIVQIKWSHGIFEFQTYIRTTSFSQIFERLMYNRLLSFVNKWQLLYHFQFEFRCGHSPELALTCLVDKISNALENGEYVLGLFLDFSKAFESRHFVRKTRVSRHPWYFTDVVKSFWCFISPSVLGCLESVPLW